MLTLRLLFATLLSAAVAPLTLANSFSATYTVQMSVDAGKATPQTATDRAMIQGAAMLGWFEVGTITDSGTLAGGVFRLKSMGTGSRALKTLIPDDRLEINRTSEGQVRQGNLVTLRFTDKRGSSALLTYSADIAKKRYEMRRAGQVTETGALKFAAVDIASLPYLFLGRPAPTAPFSVAYTDAKSVKLAGFRITRENLAVAGATVATTKLTSASSNPNDPRIELWLRNEDSFPLRVRVGVSARYGAIADQTIKALPPVFKAG
jgi:hypothetical protein